MSSREPSQTAGGASPSAHTPGPWSITSEDGDGLYVTAPDDGNADDPWNIALAFAACGYPGDPRSGSTQANARLIAAAPDLLEALQLVLSIVAPEGAGSAFISAGTERTARAAIAKALDQ